MLYEYTKSSPGCYELGAPIAPGCEDFNSDEYRRRMDERLPIHYPRIRVGDVVKSPLSGQPAPVVRVSWDAPPSHYSYWRISIPGYSGESCQLTDEPHQYVQTSPDCWATAHTLSPYVDSPVPRVELYIPTSDEPDAPWQQGRKVETLTPPVYHEAHTSQPDALIVVVTPRVLGIRPSVQIVIDELIRPTVSPPVIPQTVL